MFFQPGLQGNLTISFLDLKITTSWVSYQNHCLRLRTSPTHLIMSHGFYHSHQLVLLPLLLSSYISCTRLIKESSSTVGVTANATKKHAYNRKGSSLMSHFWLLALCLEKVTSKSFSQDQSAGSC